MYYTARDLLGRHARHAPHQVAAIDGATSITYAGLDDLARRTATAIAEHATPGDRVAVLAPRCIPTMAILFGAYYAATIPVVIHEQLRARQVARILHDCEPALICITERHRRLLRDADLPGCTVVVGDLSAETAMTDPVPLIGGDLASLLYTSGSSGPAKGVAVTHTNLVAGATIVADYLQLSSSDRTLALLPWCFDYGLNQVLATFAAGGTVVIQRSPQPSDICRTLEAAKVTGLAGVPTLWSSLAASSSRLITDQLPHLRYLTNSGGALPPDLVRTLSAAQPQAQLYLMYGLTEAFRSTYLDPAEALTRPTSIGRAIPGCEILVLDEADRPCPAGQIGELVHRGPTVARGYWRDPIATAAVFRPHPKPAPDGGTPETVVFSGDYVRADDEGFLYYVGRRDETFKSRGIRVTPTEIENEIVASGLVEHAVVAAVPSDGGIHIAVAVTLADGRTLGELDAFCQRELPAHMVPDRLVAFDQMPTTAHSKLDRTVVRAHLAAGEPATRSV